MFSFWIRPELALLNEQPPAVRSNLINEARAKAMKDWRAWLFLAVLLVAGSISALSLASIAIRQGSMWMSGLIPTVATFGCLPISWLLVEWKLVPKHLRKLMVEHGIEICIKCGYDLRASKDRCPECGCEFEKQ